MRLDAQIQASRRFDQSIPSVVACAASLQAQPLPHFAGNAAGLAQGLDNETTVKQGRQRSQQPTLFAQVALEAASGRMKVLTVLPEAEVVRILRELGEPATLSTAADDAGACCGCGCRSGQG